eukprot:gnl/Hemi2/22801_TR7635_c0_g1_i1.p1 gnl/Hemi2/22801_TR7635_c0_g1~~gnl/Hemi2/22801_TR7635_c0_g1_i1.p1  ORF type:complete len:170 (+),score=36.37 gnl/Hemi2/22801_TR7635_c0_g1_i1:191-700(+)
MSDLSGDFLLMTRKRCLDALDSQHPEDSPGRRFLRPKLSYEREPAQKRPCDSADMSWEETAPEMKKPRIMEGSIPMIRPRESSFPAPQPLVNAGELVPPRLQPPRDASGRRLYTEEEVAVITAKREEAIRGQYDAILLERLQEQFENFSKFTEDYVYRHLKTSQYSYMS